MSQVTVYSASGVATKKSAVLDPAIFEVKADNYELIKSAYLASSSQLRNAHPKTLDRGEVRGGGRKPWRQKGTGRARHGSIRSPLWRGGGVVFGPTVERKNHWSVSRQARRLAIRQVLSLLQQQQLLAVVDKLIFEKSSTKAAAHLVKAIAPSAKRVLMVVNEINPSIQLSFRNIAGLKVVHPKQLNVYDLLNCDFTVIQTSALETLSYLLPKTVLKGSSK